MILTVSVVTGFQNKIRDKVISFGAHIQVTSLNQDYLYESVPVLKSAPFVEEINQVPGVSKVQPFGFRPGILQSGQDSITYELKKQGKDTTIIRQEIKSVLVKGIDANYDASFFENHIKKGEMLEISDDTLSNDVVVSRKIAEQLHLEVGEEVRAYFVDQKGPKIRKFSVKGIYHTGMEEFDTELIFADLRHIQKLNNWGLDALLNLSDTCVEQQHVLNALATGGNQNYFYDWGQGFGPYGGIAFCPTKDTTFQVIIADFERGTSSVYPDEYAESLSVPDTAWVAIQVKGETPDCFCTTPDSIHYDDDGMGKTQYFSWGSIRADLITTSGTGELYCGGYEILVDDWERLQQIKNEVFMVVPGDFKVASIAEIHPQIFNWLDFLDTNVLIIIVLMVVIAVINMSSALLVLILEKTNMIGMLKALGANSWSVRKIFLYLSAFLIGRGLLWGNVIGIGLALIQLYFEPLQLDPEVYYLEAAPIELSLLPILLINTGTMLVCLVMLILPSIIVNKISAIKAIRFD